MYRSIIRKRESWILIFLSTYGMYYFRMLKNPFCFTTRVRQKKFTSCFHAGHHIKVAVRTNYILRYNVTIQMTPAHFGRATSLNKIQKTENFGKIKLVKLNLFLILSETLTLLLSLQMVSNLPNISSIYCFYSRFAMSTVFLLSDLIR